MNRTESTSPQLSYVLEVGVIIGGVLSELAFRHDCRTVTLGVVIVGTERGTEERDAHAGITHCRAAIHTSPLLIGPLMTKGPEPNLN